MYTQGMKTRWQRFPTPEGGVAAILLHGEVVRGWVVSRSGQVWSSYRPPLSATPDQRVNIWTDGLLIGVYPDSETAMEVVTAKWLQRLRQLSSSESSAQGTRSAGPSSPP
jgi:hypothetical protein